MKIADGFVTLAEARAHNAGVLAVLAIASRSAAAINGTTHRRVHEEFAVAALAELATAGRALLIQTDPPDAAAGVEPSPLAPAPIAGAIEVAQ